MQNQQITRENERYLQFKMGEEYFALPLLSVKEVIPPPETTPLPQAPGYYIGIMNLRGQVLSVVDLRKRLKVKPAEVREEAVIIIQRDDVAIGFLVDSIEKVLSFNPDENVTLDNLNNELSTDFVDGIYRGEESLTVILKMESLINTNEIAKISA